MSIDVNLSWLIFIVLEDFSRYSTKYNLHFSCFVFNIQDSISCGEIPTTPGDETAERNKETRSRPRSSFKSPDADFFGKTDSNPKPRKRLPKVNSATACLPSASDSSNPVTPEKMKIKRSASSASSSYRKPATPYNVTPQIGSRRSSKAAAFVASRTPLLL